mmetsp:Transcript_23659/g.60485  ORF Transcript_23659/g.60485 Transcript_23659/m.60485 type:complete len:137 (-) Transcript_23659:494-904(-)
MRTLTAAYLMVALVVAQPADELNGQDYAPIVPKCDPYHCKASCCHFSEPKKECGACDPKDESNECRPGADCYETGSSGAPSPPADLPPDCHEWCRDTPHCCWFANPVDDCKGCPADTFGCHAGAECYPEGRKKVEL